MKQLNRNLWSERGKNVYFIQDLELLDPSPILSVQVLSFCIRFRRKSQTLVFEGFVCEHLKYTF